MRVVYICGPLWSPWWIGRLINIVRAARAAWQHWRKGRAVICPHLNAGIFGLLWGPAERMARWLDGDIALINRLSDGPGGDELYVLPGWSASVGSQREVCHAFNIGLTLTFAPGAELPGDDGREMVAA
jgi:hypothetical protein